MSVRNPIRAAVMARPTLEWIAVVVLGITCGAAVALGLPTSSNPLTDPARSPAAASLRGAPPGQSLALGADWRRQGPRPYEPSPVDPLWVGPTLYRLDETSGFVLLPIQGPGYYHFGGADAPDEDAWGDPVTIACIETVGRAWHERWPGRPRIGIGDISLRRGGPFPPHSEHRTGLDIDIRPVSHAGEDRVTVGSPNFDQAGTRDLIGLFFESCQVERVFFNDPQLRSALSLVAPARGHHNHLHVRLAPPAAQPPDLRQYGDGLLGWVEVADEEVFAASR